MAGAHHTPAEDDGTTGDRSLPAVDPRSLLVFREVGRLGSLTAAADALGWTQPAVSQHVRRLERSLGVPLAVRQGRGIEITQAGHALLRHADAVAGSLRAAAREMDDHARARAGVVRIAAFPSASATLVADCVRMMATRHPGIEVRLSQLEPPEAAAALSSADCDIAVVFAHDPVAPDQFPDFDRIELLNDPIRLVLPPHHPLTGRGALGLAELHGERWVGGCPSCRQHLLESAAAAGFTPDIRHSTDDYVVVQALVASDLAVATLPSLALRASRNENISVHPIKHHSPRRVLALTRKNAQRVTAVRTTLDTLLAAAEQLPAEPP